MFLNSSTWNLLEESGTYRGECLKKVASGRKLSGTSRSLLNAGYKRYNAARHEDNK